MCFLWSSETDCACWHEILRSSNNALRAHCGQRVSALSRGVKRCARGPERVRSCLPLPARVRTCARGVQALCAALGQQPHARCLDTITNARRAHKCAPTHAHIQTSTHARTVTPTPTHQQLNDPLPPPHTLTHSLDIWGVAVSITFSNKTIYGIGCRCRGHRAYSATFGIALLHEYHLRRAMRSKQPSVTTYQKHTPCTTTLASASPVPS